MIEGIFPKTCGVAAPGSEVPWLQTTSLLELLLRAQVVSVAATTFAAIGGAWWKARITFSANHLFAVVFLGI